jgi:hypothetical protein
MNYLILFLSLIFMASSVFGQGKLRDPFYPPFQNSPKLFTPSTLPDLGYNQPPPEPIVEKILLSGIIWDEERPYALIMFQNRRLTVSVNDYVADKQVVQITKSRVMLKSRAKTYILEVGKELSL